VKIGFFTSIQGWGGSETYLRTLMLGVRDAGHEAVLFGVDGSRLISEMRDAGLTCVPWTDRGQDIGCLVDPDTGAPERNVAGDRPRAGGARLRIRLLGCVPQWARLALGCAREVRRLQRLFRRHAVDVMHVSIHGYELAGLACRRCGIPCLGMHMTSPIEEGYWFRRRLIRHTDRRYDHVCSQSKACTDAWIALTGLNPERCSFVWNGVDVARFERPTERRPDAGDEPFRLVSVGRLHPMKGHDYVLEALRLLGDTRCRWDIVGTGTPAELAAIESGIADRGLERVVRLVGHSEEPEEWLWDAHAFVLASVELESCPAVLAEAMAAGLPLITSDFGPLAEVNRDAVTGIVVPAADSAALAKAIGELADAPERCLALGRAGRERAVSLFSKERMVQETLRRYERIVR